MENLNLTQLKPKLWCVRMGLTIGLALLLFMAVLWGLRGMTPALADPGMLYVNGTVGQDTGTCGTVIAPCQTISYTLNSRAGDGDSILVAAGRYSENLTIADITVTLRGGYSISGTLWLPSTGETVIHGGDTDRVFFIHNSNSVLKNLTITGGAADSSECWGDAVWVTNGNATIRSATIKDKNGVCNAIEVNHDFGPGHLTLESSTVSNMDMGGAVHVWGESASATIVDVTFVDNTNWVGGAIHVDGDSSAVIRNSRIFSNSAISFGGGIAIWDGASAVIVNSRIFSNTANIFGGGISIEAGASAMISGSQIYSNTAMLAGGGGISVDSGTLTLSNSWVRGNSAPNGQSGGIDIGVYSTVNVVDSVIADNSALEYGGAATINIDAMLDLTNVLITGNSTASGTANVFATLGDVNIMNSTISDNNPQGAQGILLWSGHLTITNGILWNNALSLQADPPCQMCFTVRYTDIEGGWTGTGNVFNIDADPRFVGGGDYRLQEGSPCIDAGTNTGAPDHDMDHRPRPQDGDKDGTATADMGAYEFRQYKIYLPFISTNSGP